MSSPMQKKYLDDRLSRHPSVDVLGSLREAPFLALRQDLDAKKALLLAVRAWCATAFFLLAMLVAMGIVWSRLSRCH